MSTDRQMPAWLRDAAGEDGMPAWLRNTLRGTGGHQATAAEKRAAFARFTAVQDAVRSRGAARGRVFASARPPGEVSPFARQVFGAGR